MIWRSSMRIVVRLAAAVLSLLSLMLGADLAIAGPVELVQSLYPNGLPELAQMPVGTSNLENQQLNNKFSLRVFL